MNFTKRNLAKAGSEPRISDHIPTALTITQQRENLLYAPLVTARNVFTGVCHSVHRGVVWQTSPGQTHPHGQTSRPPGRHPTPRAGTSPGQTHPSPAEMATASDGMHSCFMQMLPANEVWGKVMFYTCLWFCSQGGVCPIACWDTHTSPWTVNPPRADTHQSPTLSGHPPLGRHPLPSDTTGYGQQARGTHPAGMHTCLIRQKYFYGKKNWFDL